MKQFLLIAGLLSMANLPAAEDDHKNQLINVSVHEKLDIAAITHSLVLQDIGDEAWTSFVSKARKRFEEWSREYDNNNVKQFLDDKLLALAPGVKSGKGARLREFCKWMALYNEFSEPLPHYISDISDDDKRWIANVLSDFDWDRAALTIKEKARE
jgi:hypothetical protein